MAARLAYLRGKIQRNLGAYAEAEREYLAAAEAFSGFGDAEARADALSGAALTRWGLGDYGEATRLQLEALGLYEALGDARGLANANNTVGLIAWRRRDRGEAMRRFEKATELYEGLSNAQGLAAAINNLAGLYEDLGDLERSEAYYLEAIRQYDSSGDAAGAAMARGNLSWILARRGEALAAEGLAERAMAELAKLGSGAAYYRAMMQRGQAYRAAGKPRAAAYSLYRAAHGAKLASDAELEAVAIGDLVEALGDLGLHARVGAWYRRLMALEAAFLSRDREREIARLNADHEAESRRRRAEELEEALKDRDRLLATMYHDARASMARLKASLAAMAFEAPGMAPAEYRARAMAVFEDASTMEAEFESAMAWARSKDGSLAPSFEDIALGPLVDACAAAVRGFLAAKGVTVEIDPAIAGLKASGDARMLRVALGNIAGNAAKHASPGEPLSFRAEPAPPGFVRLEASNAAHSARGEGSSVGLGAAPPGSGIGGFGLVVCSDFAALMGGAFEFAVERGRAVARLTLPMARGGADGPE